LFRQDPVASCQVPADGRYFVLLREASYRGDDRCRYRLHLGTFPRPLVASPPGGRPGTELDVTLLGDVRGPILQHVRLPADASPEAWVFPEQDGVPAPSGVAIRVIGGNASVFDGVIGKPGEVASVKFHAAANQPLHLRVNARSVRSPLDPVLSIHAADGRQLESNDDAIGLDSYVRFTPPADGDYVARITDQLGAGGPLYVWRLVIAPVVPSLTLDLPRFGRDSQARQTIAVARGNRTAFVVHAARGEFGGDVAVAATDLPDGVTLSAVPMSKSVDTTLLLLEARPDAPLSGRAVDLIGSCGEPEVRGRLHQRFELVVAPPNDTSFYEADADRLAVAVTEEVPFSLSIETPKVPLVQGGVQSLVVHAARAEGFGAPIVVRMLWLPPGLGSQPTLTLEQGQSDLAYPVNANGDAPPSTWQLALLGETDSGRGAVFASSALVPLTVAPPFLSLKLDLAATEQGKPAQVVAHVETTTPFEGKATVKLHGLPPKCSAPDVEMAAGDTSVVFDVTTAADTPAGKHNSLFCEVDVVQDGVPIVHFLGGGGTLRVDAPAPAPAKPAAVAAAPEQPAAKPEKPAKPLSRLEQLRLEAKQKAEAAAGAAPAGGQ